MKIDASGAVMANRYNYLTSIPPTGTPSAAPDAHDFAYKENEHKMGSTARRLINDIGQVDEPRKMIPAVARTDPWIRGAHQSTHEHRRHHLAVNPKTSAVKTAPCKAGIATTCSCRCQCVRAQLLLQRRPGRWGAGLPGRPTRSDQYLKNPWPTCTHEDHAYFFHRPFSLDCRLWHREAG